MVGPVGTGHLILVVEVAQRLNRNEREPAIVAAASSRESLGAQPNLVKLVTELEDHDRHAVVMTDEAGEAPAALRDASLLARGLAGGGVDVLQVVDMATAEAAGGPAQLKALAGLSPGGGSVTLILLDPYGPGFSPPTDAGMDTRLVFSADQLALRIYPALDPVASRSGFQASDLADEIRDLLARSDQVRRYFGQSLVVARDYTGEEPTWVDRVDAEAELAHLMEAAGSR
jgi:hypothetical protein